MIIRALLILLALLALLAIWQRGSLANAQRTADAAEVARDAAQAELEAASVALGQAHAVIDTERRNAAAANALAANYEQERNHAQAAADRLAADLRAERQRLHPRWEACPAADNDLPGAAAGSGIADGGTAGRIDSAARIIGATAADAALIRGLQAFALLCSTPVTEVAHDRTAGDRPDVQRRSAVPAAQQQTGAR